MKTRRQFFSDLGCGLGSAALFSAFDRFSRLEAATVAAPGDYRALVCVFLAGGNDGNNTVIPYDDYAAYQAVRGANLNIPKDTLLKVAAASQRADFGLHPALAEIHPLYAQGKLAVLANAGPLAGPLTREEYAAGGPRPDNLFSHSDQQALWQSAVSSSVDPLVRTGWGGRTADLLASSNVASFPMVVSTSGVPLFGTGERARPLVPGTSLSGFGSGAAATARYAALRKLLALETGALLVDEASVITANAIDDLDDLTAAPKAEAGDGLPFDDPRPAARHDRPGRRRSCDAADEPADLLRLARELRHARRPARHAAEPPLAAEPGARRLPRRHGRARRRERRHQLHPLRLRPHLPAQLRRRHRPP
jgi:uncharacterized protein (DUF1501 family)